MVSIFISHEKKIPIYVQIADQFKEMVHTGILGNGDALPGRQALAKQICVNINTINHAYRILEHEGYIVSRRGLGSFVNLMVDHKSRDDLFDKIRNQLMHLRGRALAFGLSLNEFNSILEGILFYKSNPSRPRALFIECHEAWTNTIASRLQEEIGIEVKPIIMPDRKTNLKEVIEATKLADFVITTHAHYDEVREITDSEKVIFPLDLHLSYDVMTSLAKIREGKIAVPFLKPVTTKRLGHWIKAMGFQIDLVSIKHKDLKDLAKKVEGYKNLMVPPNHLTSVEEMMLEGINIIPIRSVLGEESVKYLKKNVSKMYPGVGSKIEYETV